MPVNDASDPTLAALFCIGPTASSAVNAAAGLPGLGRLELMGLLCRRLLTEDLPFKEAKEHLGHDRP